MKSLHFSDNGEIKFNDKTIINDIILGKRTNIPKQKWNGDSPTFQNLRWVDGHYQKTLHPHQSRSIETTQKKQSFDDEFQKSIQDSVKLEQLDHKIK